MHVEITSKITKTAAPTEMPAMAGVPRDEALVCDWELVWLLGVEVSMLPLCVRVLVKQYQDFASNTRSSVSYPLDWLYAIDRAALSTLEAMYCPGVNSESADGPLHLEEYQS